MEPNKTHSKSLEEPSDYTSGDQKQKNRPLPTRRIHPRAVPAWRISGGLSSMVYFLIPVFLSSLVWGTAFQWAVYVLSGLVLLNTVLQSTVIPYIRWRHWRYEVDEHEIDLKRGIFIIRRTLIPIKRVQHVDTQQCPILRSYELATVTISTAATTHEIPALAEDVADEVRHRISHLARLAKDDDV